jgi:hypothetical protein
MDQYAGGHCTQAIPRFEAALELCPTPDRPLIVKSDIFLGQHQYAPFYYLGNCLFSFDETPKDLRALRNFYRSDCTGEPTRSSDVDSVLPSSTKDCKLRITQKGGRYKERFFRDGFDAQKRSWETSAQKMWEVLQVDVLQVIPEEENVRMVNASGRWPDPYLPRLWLAEALSRLGCYQLACEQIKQSRLNQLSDKKYEKERQKGEHLLLECVNRARERSDNEVCQRWQCWLERGGLREP